MEVLMKIGFASNDWSRSAKDALGRPVMGGSGYIRIGQYIQHFKKSGLNAVVGILAHNTHTGTFGVHSWDGKDYFDCDVIVMQRYMHKQVLPDMARAQSMGQIVLQDVDDWYWGLSEKNHAYDACDPSKNPDENIDWYENIIKNSDGVITSTPFLFNKMSMWNENVALHTNYVDTRMFSKPYTHERKSKIVVGWMGSTAHRSGDLQILRPYTSKISQFASWHHTGHIEIPNWPRFTRELGVEGGNTTTSPFVAPYELNTGIKFDVGIVPLTNIPFNHAKSYIKGLEYAAAGVPFVCSWSPQYEELTKEHGIGVLASKPADYVKELEKFRDFGYRTEVATKNRTSVRKFDSKIGAERLYKNIKKLVDDAK
jgi:hypothetical protein